MAEARPNFHVLSGCSGGGKSSLLTELARRGFDTVDEPGRAIVKEQLEIDGDGLPWENPEKFLELAIARSMREYERRCDAGNVVFFDRSIVDALLGLEELHAPLPEAIRNAATRYPYGPRVFMLPPWPEIYRTDAERRHGFDEALAEYERLVPGYERRGYEVVLVPQAPIVDRADFLLREVGLLDH